VENALHGKLTTNYGSKKKLIILRDEDPVEFDHLWNFIKKNCDKKLPNWTPVIITRCAIENGSSVNIPEIGEVILIPREVPIFLINATYKEVDEGEATLDDVFLVGTVGDIDKWLKESKANIRFIFDIIISMISIIIGILLEFNNKKSLKT